VNIGLDDIRLGIQGEAKGSSLASSTIRPALPFNAMINWR
jgi:hypothetical protein